jgi:hypothetical protein
MDRWNDLGTKYSKVAGRRCGLRSHSERLIYLTGNFWAYRESMAIWPKDGWKPGHMGTAAL